MKYEHLITIMFFGIYFLLFEMVYHVGTVTEKDEHLSRLLNRITAL